jgi:FPC/CPF motif-containing protein YcgG
LINVVKNLGHRKHPQDSDDKRFPCIFAQAVGNFQNTTFILATYGNPHNPYPPNGFGVSYTKFTKAESWAASRVE